MKYKNRVWSFSWNYTNTNEQIKWDFSIMYKMAQSWITSYLSEAFIKISNLKELGQLPEELEVWTSVPSFWQQSSVIQYFCLNSMPVASYYMMETKQ